MALGNTTGAKAVFSAIVILALIGFKVWNRTPHYRSELNETFQISVDEYFTFNFTTDEDVKFKAEITKETGDDYAIYLVTGKAFAEIAKIDQTGKGDIKNISFVFERESSSDETFSDIRLEKGDYYLVIDNLGKSDLSGEIELYSYQ